jgi:hypothetical protein
MKEFLQRLQRSGSSDDNGIVAEPNENEVRFYAWDITAGIQPGEQNFLWNLVFSIEINVDYYCGLSFECSKISIVSLKRYFETGALLINTFENCDSANFITLNCRN